MIGDGLDTAISAGLHWTSRGLEITGIIAIVGALLVAVIRSLTDVTGGSGSGTAYHQFRQTLGRGILLGLELLVAADIIGTVAVEPTLENVLVLSLIVLIRTFLSISLTVEIEGRWPWQSNAKLPPEGDATPSTRAPVG